MSLYRVVLILSGLHSQHYTVQSYEEVVKNTFSVPKNLIQLKICMKIRRVSVTLHLN